MLFKDDNCFPITYNTYMAIEYLQIGYARNKIILDFIVKVYYNFRH